MEIAHGHFYWILGAFGTKAPGSERVLFSSWDGQLYCCHPDKFALDPAWLMERFPNTPSHYNDSHLGDDYTVPSLVGFAES